MSLQLKVNFSKGWPSPYIVEEVLAPHSGVTIEQGLIGRRSSTNTWVLGVTAISQNPFVFRNESVDPDSGRASEQATEYAQVPFGGIQGISFRNPLEIETTQYVGTPAVGTLLFANTDGKLETATSGDIAIAIVTKAEFNIGTSTYIRVEPITMHEVA